MSACDELYGFSDLGRGLTSSEEESHGDRIPKTGCNEVVDEYAKMT